MPGAVLSTGHSVVTKTDMVPLFIKLSLEGTLK